MSQGVKVFSATKHEDRRKLGDVVTKWLDSHPEYKVTREEVRQSSDNEYHCLSIVIFYEK